MFSAWIGRDYEDIKDWITGAFSLTVGLVKMKALPVLAIACFISLKIVGQSWGLQVADNNGETEMM